MPRFYAKSLKAYLIVFMIYLFIRKDFLMMGKEEKSADWNFLPVVKSQSGEYPIILHSLWGMDLVKGVYKRQQFRNNNIKIRRNFFIDIQRR